MSDDRPKVCAVCGYLLSGFGKGPLPSPDDEWIHVQELVGEADHVAIPVDYDAVPINVKCDFCHQAVGFGQDWTVPATDFEMPMPPGAPTGHVSLGNWGACDECASLIRRKRWTQLINRALDAFQEGERRPVSPAIRQALRRHLTLAYSLLERHMTGPVRPWRAGDEKG